MPVLPAVASLRDAESACDPSTGVSDGAVLHGAPAVFGRLTGRARGRRSPQGEGDEHRTADTDFHQFGFLTVVNPLSD